MSIELHCVRERNRLRMRIASYTSEAGVKHEHVYNNSLNCRFPKALRGEGRIYRVPASAVRLLGGCGVAPYYSVSAAHIVIVQGNALVDRVYEVSTECVVCMNEPSTAVFAPCGHYCTCAKCASALAVCCICRARIQETLKF